MEVECPGTLWQRSSSGSVRGRFKEEKGGWDRLSEGRALSQWSGSFQLLEGNEEKLHTSFLPKMGTCSFVNIYRNLKVTM